ncbi:hypothetical protein DY000_02019374 [Brassica cretica]|uniref:Uncharacterized protein n=1 Tax=Brassica cretica TaxID=69181 RepID=A0ABQ7D8J6_BRACR|nr:hypothetical protein DY000_02019374 [Brassica cretica]
MICFEHGDRYVDQQTDGTIIISSDTEIRELLVSGRIFITRISKVDYPIHHLHQASPSRFHQVSSSFSSNLSVVVVFIEPFRRCRLQALPPSSSSSLSAAVFIADCPRSVLLR